MIALPFSEKVQSYFCKSAKLSFKALLGKVVFVGRASSSHHYHHEVYVKNCALRENAHGLIAGARTPWQLFNTVSRPSEHEATNATERKPTPHQTLNNDQLES